MPQASKTFRIFVSSTFSDLKEERNALQRYVFPRLRELCMQHGCRFQAIDLRWGVSEEAALDQQTMKICLEEIKRCRKTTPRPNFLVLLGDRYGWQPLPFEIPASEFEQIELLIAEQRDRDLLAHWYRRDDNADPAVYCLQPRERELSDAETDEQKHAARDLEFVEWSEIEAELRRILLAPVERPSLNQEQKLKYQASATAQEVEAGALSVDDTHEHVFCFFRTIRSLPPDESAKDFVDLKKNGDRFELDSDAHARQNALREDRLRVKLPNNIFDYETEWKRTTEVDATASTRCKNVIDSITSRLAELTREQHGIKLTIEDLENLRETKASALQQTVNAPQDEGEEIESPISLAHIPELCADVFLSLARVILEEIALIEEADALDKEIESHKDFGEDRARFFVGRQTYLDRISDYLHNDAAHPLAVHGESGTGKSALMARAVAPATKDHPAAVIVRRFIGATPSSSDGRALLESLCKELTKRYDEDEQSVPAEYQKLAKDFQKRLELATQDKPLIIFLDALDQLSENEHARNLAWLPNKLPPQVHVIVSTLPGECLSHLERKLPADNLLKLDPMTSSEGDDLLDLWLADAKRRLEPAQRESVLKEFMVNGLPLYLKLVFEEARRWKSYSLAQRFPADIPGMILAMFRRLMSDHGQMLIERALGYIAAARHGLSEDELLDVLSMDKEVFDDFFGRAHHRPPEQRLPVVIWSRLYFDLEPYLTERSADGTNLLGFYHRQLSEVVTEEFLAGEAKRERHIALGKFFAGQDYFLETLEAQRERARRSPPTARPANLRKASELLWQLLHAEQSDQVECLLMDLSFLEAKAEAGLISDLARDFRSALNSLPSKRKLKGQSTLLIVELLERAVLYDLQFIGRHPTALFQCLWNRCWWYDCREAANYYESSDGPWNQVGNRLSTVLQNWRLLKDKATPGFPWIRSRRPLSQAAAEVAVLKGHGKSVRGVAYTPDGKLIISAGFAAEGEGTGVDGTGGIVQVWDAATTENLATFAVPELIFSLTVTPDGQRLLAGCWDSVLVLDGGSGAEVGRLKANGHAGIAVAPTPDGTKIVTGDTSSPYAIRVWDLVTMSEIKLLRGHEKAVRAITVTPDSRFAISGSDDCSVRVWDIRGGLEVATLWHTNAVNGVAISGDGLRLISSSLPTVRVWETATWSARAEMDCGVTEPVRKYSAESVAGFPDGTRFVVGCSDAVRVWNADGEELAVLRGHEGGVTTVAVAPDGKQIVSGGDKDKTVRIWDVEVGTSTTVSGKLQAVVRNSTLTSDGTRIICGCQDSDVRVFDAETGVQVALPLHSFLNSHAVDILVAPDGRHIVCGGKSHSLTIWDATTGDMLAEADRGRFYGITPRLLTPDGRLIVCLWRGLGLIDVLDAATATNVLLIRGHESAVTDVAVAPDGQWIVSGSDDCTVRIWDLGSGMQTAVLRGHTFAVSAVAVTPDGQWVVSGSYDRTLRVWSTSSWSQQALLCGHTAEITRVVVSTDGKRIASSSADGTTRLWDASTNDCIEVVQGSGDLPDMVEGGRRFPFRALSRGWETVIEESASSRAVASFPVGLPLRTYPSGRTWVGVHEGRLYILSLEGDV